MQDDVIDEAIEVAAVRAHAAQELAAAEIEVTGAPDEEITEVIVRRAEDLEMLAGDAAEDVAAPDDEEAADRAERSAS